MATTNDLHAGIGTSFADPADVVAFKRCKAAGKSDHECFKVGDNGVGFWGDDCKRGSGSAVAVIPEDMIEKWGSMRAAHNKVVFVTKGSYGAYARVKDRMPYRAHVKHGAILDMNPDLCDLLSLRIPVETPIAWRWANADEGEDQV